MCGYLAFLFELNEYLPKAHKLTDYQIAHLCGNEFPDSQMMQRLFQVVCQERVDRRSRQSSVQYYRYRYNGGFLFPTKGKRKGPISFKYNQDGDKISLYNPKGGLLSQKEHDRMIQKFGPDIRLEQDFNIHIQKHDRVRRKPGPPTYESFDWCI